jgi:NAD dependent epimerase/dehydratase family enzyme
MLRTALGGFADEALLASQRLSPVKLLDSGYRFLSTDLLGALKVMLAA